jgi:hypothetical protein
MRHEYKISWSIMKSEKSKLKTICWRNWQVAKMSLRYDKPETGKGRGFKD